MEISFINDFLVLADTCNYYEAAARLYISQPALSKHIQRLEKDIGAPLFIRTTRRVELSEFGKEFLPYAQKIVDAQNAYIGYVNTKLAKTGTILSIASIPVMDQYDITGMISRFKAANPDINIRVYESFETDPYILLKEGKCEYAFVREEETPPEDDYVRFHYAADELVAVLNKNHPFAGHKKIALNLLSDNDFFLAQTKTKLYMNCVQACRNAGFEPNVTFTGHRLENIINFVSEGLGVSLLTRRQAKYLLNKNVRIVNITPGYRTFVNLVYDRAQEKTYAGKTFINYLKKYNEKQN